MTLAPIFQWLGRQDWLRFGLRDRVIRSYCDPDTVSPLSFTIPFFGQKYPGNLNSFLDWFVFFYGGYELQSLYLYRDLLKSETAPVMLDVGANVGHHTLFLAQHCAQVHCFEPNPTVREKLNEKVRVNNLRHVRIHPVGLGFEDAKLPFFAPAGSNEGTGSFVSGYSDNNRPVGNLEVVNGDKYVGNLGLGRIDLVKIDVEGFERYVLQGLQATFALHRPIIIMEYSHATRASFSDSTELFSLLPQGYTAHWISANRPLWKFFNSPNYRLLEFEFDRADCDLVLAPAELTDRLLQFGK